MPIYVTKPSLPNYSDYIEEIRPIFESHILTNSGPIYQRFQKELEEFLEVAEVSLFVNGHLALEMAIHEIVKEKKDDTLEGEVITTPFTFVSTTHSITRNNLKPVFCDIKREDCCLDPDQIENLINEKTVAIVPVHVYGNICDVEKIEHIARKYDLKVIYDGAHAFGEKYKKRPIACFGDATMFSFHATKVFNSIEGGAVAFQDKKYREALEEIKNFGIHEEDVPVVGANGKMDEFRAAMGICNLKGIRNSIDSRRKVFDRYVERLSGINGIQLVLSQKEVEYNYAYFPVVFEPDLFGKNRDVVISDLKKHDIYARKYFYPAVNEMTCYKNMNNGLTPVAHYMSENVLTLPIYEGLQAEDVDRICDIIVG